MAFDVQYWTGAAWATVPGGAVTGNDKVWRKLTFPAVTTTKIRVLARGGADGYSRIVEVEAWGSGADARRLVTDQLGTPRMVLDAGGQLSGVSRHDYLPFGEEIAASVGGRVTTPGYGKADNLRQKFTGYERDTELRLDFAQARYYSSAQGRFTSTDPILMKTHRLNDPQQFNLYAYARNNPLKFNDPNGEDITRVDTTRKYEFTIERREGELLRQIQVSVTEVTSGYYYSDDKTPPSLIGTDVHATATAVNTDQANIRLTPEQLETAGKVAGEVVSQAGGRGVSREIALGIAAKETFLGTDPRPGAKDFQQPAINPMQLSGGRANTDLAHNVAGAVEVYLERSKNQTLPLKDSFYRYGPGKKPGGLPIRKKSLNM